MSSANQPPPLEHWNLADSDLGLIENLDRQGAGWALDDVRELGTRLGEPEVMQWGFDANRFAPELASHDRFGERIDEVAFHPAWHHLVGMAVDAGLHGAPWADERAGSHVARAAKFYLVSQNEAGHGCPISMTYSIVPALRTQPELAGSWEPGLTNRSYDSTSAPPSSKTGLLAGMAMTERQGGTDVRANTTRARPVNGGGPGAEYRLDGQKWFCSAPMCDAFLVLAQAPGGLSCFLLPRWCPDDTRNGFHIERLKDKVGNRSNASSEVRFEDAFAWMVGEEGRGVPTIIEMVNHTRLDCVIGSAAIMRQAVTQAVHHTAHRRVFGSNLVDLPLMRRVLADLVLETEAATTVMLRLAGAFDRASADPGEAALRRVATPVVKFWTTKRATPVIVEALECHGGNGYVEESPMARLYRESPLNSIWEGSGNVMCLDVLRALRSEGAADAFVAELELARGSDRRVDLAVDQLAAQLRDPANTIEGDARRLVTRMALLLQATLLLRFAPTEIADAFVTSRVEDDVPAVLGAAQMTSDPAPILDRIQIG